MALVTKRLASFDDDSCRWELDYDDVDLRARTVRCVNNSAKPTTGTVRRGDGTGPTYTATIQAGQTQEVNVPTGAAQRLQLSIGDTGHLIGVSTSFTWG